LLEGSLDVVDVDVGWYSMYGIPLLGGGWVVVNNGGGEGVARSVAVMVENGGGSGPEVGEGVEKALCLIWQTFELECKCLVVV
jgi:hypothetical protein